MGVGPQRSVPSSIMEWGYREIARDLERRIHSGEYPAGEPLPGGADWICRHYGVGMQAANKALGRLRTVGAIDTRPGRLPTVRPQIERHEAWMRSHTRVVPRPASLAELEEMGLPDGTWLLEVYHRGSFKIYRADEVELWFE